MATLKLASLINPHPCNPAQEDRNWAALNQIMQILDQIIEINIDETTNEYVYNLININEITATQIDVTNIDVTNEINVETINVTYVYATEINSSFVTSYNITYELLYSGDVQVCPDPCGSGSSGSGGSGGSGGCSAAAVVDNMPDTLYCDVDWGGGITTITLTKYSSVASASGAGYAEKRYSGSGSITGGSTLQMRLWVYKSCNGSPTEANILTDYCAGVFMSDLNNRSSWPVAVVNSDSPFDIFKSDESTTTFNIGCGTSAIQVTHTVYE